MRKVLAYIGAGIGGVIALAIVSFAGWGSLYIDNLIRGEEISKLAEFALGLAAGLFAFGFVFFIIWAFETLRDRDY